MPPKVQLFTETPSIFQTIINFPHCTRFLKVIKPFIMRFSGTLITAAAVTLATAQRPEDEPICDYYTKALLKENTAENQATLLTLVVNTVVIGNCKTLSIIEVVHTSNMPTINRHNA